MVMRSLAWVLLLLLASVGLFAEFVAPSGYAAQFRDAPDAPPSARFLLGTDELGRDRFARLVYGSRVSLLLAPAASALATGVALVLGLAAAYGGRVMQSAILGAADMLACIPTLFLLLSVRAALPLDLQPAASVSVTFLLLGGLGWANGTRVIRAAAADVRGSEYVLQGRAAGYSGLRLLWRQVVPAMRPIVSANFWTSIPLFLIAEANLGILGLSVSEPLPSLGNLLADLHNYSSVSVAPWRVSPAIVVVLAILSVQTLTSIRKSS